MTARPRPLTTALVCAGLVLAGGSTAASPATPARTQSAACAAVVSLGAIEPKCGRQAGPAAHVDTAGQPASSPGRDGFAGWALAPDRAGGHDDSDIIIIRAGDTRQPVKDAGGVSNQFRLDGAVAHPGTYNLAALQALPATTLRATYQAEGKRVTDTYTGVSLWTLITNAGLLTNARVKSDVLRLLVVATGSDGYEAVFSLGEIDPAFGNQPDLVAYSDAAGQLGPGGAEGFVRLVVPGDKAGGRYVSNLISLRVIDAAPEPAAPR